MSNRTKIIIILCLFLGSIIFTSTLVTLYKKITKSDNSTTYEISAPDNMGGAYELKDHNGKVVNSVSYKGKFQLIYFGYTYCPDICPAELYNMSRALDKIGDQQNEIQPVFITIDPERDTKELLKEYVAQFHPRLVGLWGSVEEVHRVAKKFKVYYSKVTPEDANDYLVDHSTFIYLTDKNGKLISMYRRGISIDDLSQSLLKHLKHK